MTGSLFLDDVEEYLTTQGVGNGSTGWTIKKTYAPDDPDKQIVLIATPGEQPESDASGVAEQDYPGLTVHVVGAEFGAEAAHLKAKEAHVALHDSQPSGEFTFVFATGSPYDGGMGPNNRPIVSIHFRCMRDR